MSPAQVFSEGVFPASNTRNGPSSAQEIITPPASTYRKDPVNMMCPYCQAQIQTSTKSKPGALGKGVFVYYQFFERLETFHGN